MDPLLSFLVNMHRPQGDQGTLEIRTSNQPYRAQSWEMKGYKGM